MKRDSLAAFRTLRENLLREQQELTARIREIKEVLGGGRSARADIANIPSEVKTRGRKTRRGREKNTMSLRAAVLQVTKAAPLPKAEILAAVLKLGYKFSARNPMGSLNTLLYSKKHFKNVGGKFAGK